MDRLGSEVGPAEVRPGDRVIVYPWIGCGRCRRCATGQENLCEGAPGFLGFIRDGGYAEYGIVPYARDRRAVLRP